MVISMFLFLFFFFFFFKQKTAYEMRISDWSSDVCSSDLLYFTLFEGAARAGIVMAPIGWRLSPAEWSFIVNDTQAKIVFAGPGFDDVAGQLAGKLRNDPKIVGAAEAWAMIEGAERAPFEPSAVDDAVLQLYTSGTTGNPKGAVLSNRNLDRKSAV